MQALLTHSPALRDAEFTLEWACVYPFSCQRMGRFRHGRVLFAGDGRDEWLLRQLGAGLTALVAADDSIANALHGLALTVLAIAMPEGVAA